MTGLERYKGMTSEKIKKLLEELYGVNAWFLLGEDSAFQADGDGSNPSPRAKFPVRDMDYDSTPGRD